MKSRNLYNKYRKLWSSKPSTNLDRELILIEDICLRIEMANDFEQYFKMLCDGMIFLLNSKINHQNLKKHKALNLKLESLSQKVITNSNEGSDLMYLGVLIDLELELNKWNKDFYQLIQSLFSKILDFGMKISPSMRQKLERLLLKNNAELYQFLFKKLNSQFLKSTA